MLQISDNQINLLFQPQQVSHYVLDTNSAIHKSNLYQQLIKKNGDVDCGECHDDVLVVTLPLTVFLMKKKKETATYLYRQFITMRS